MIDEHLKCDADDCSHVQVVGEITAEMVDMPCPKCGSNLLTPGDWESWQGMRALFDAVKSVIPEGDDDGPKVAMRVGLHGKKTSIEIEPT
tara:strand:- start:7 stop:276 length:270 start_codon:yes stop_codon:yes gene_type:complete